MSDILVVGSANVDHTGARSSSPAYPISRAPASLYRWCLVSGLTARRGEGGRSDCRRVSASSRVLHADELVHRLRRTQHLGRDLATAHGQHSIQKVELN